MPTTTPVLGKLQKLLHHVCQEGFEHHVAMNASRIAGVLAEAFSRYLHWDVYHHEARNGDS